MEREPLVGTIKSDRPLLRKHMPELDVLRGTAILLVVSYHALNWDVGHPASKIGKMIVHASVFGWLGVNLFFVLSGFLITGILLDTKGRPDYYRRFYLRRVQRILPAYLATIAILCLFRYLTTGAVVTSLLFVANYSKALGVAAIYGPFWSLSVEEQFYLLWPMLVAKVNIRVFTVVAIAICFLDPLLRWMAGSGHLSLGDVHESTILIADNLALGALAAVFARSSRGNSRGGLRLGATMMIGGALVLLAGIPFGILHRTTTFGATFQTTPWNIFFTGLLLFLLARQSPWFSSRYAAPLRFLGYISYGLYLIHLLVFDAYDWGVRYLPASVQTTLEGALLRFFFISLLSISVAWVSRRYFEEPFLRRRPGQAPKAPPAPEPEKEGSWLRQEKSSVSVDASAQ